MKREVQIKLKAVSADHCAVSYNTEKGWVISEKNKDKVSSNGTFVFMKSHNQMQFHEPSDMIPLHDGMIISFINYEVRISLAKKDVSELAKDDSQVKQKAQEYVKQAEFSTTLKAGAEPAFVEPVAVEPKEDEK